MRQPTSMTPPVGRFADLLLASDLPRLDDARRSATVSFIEQRVSVLPSFTRFGVTVIAVLVDLVGRLIGAERIMTLIAARPIPLLAEYPRLVRSLGYAFIWETWPDTSEQGAAT